MAIYSTIQGDTWDTISYRAYNDEAYVAELVAANPDLADTVIFSGGVMVVIPIIAAPADTSNLPPWRSLA